MRYLVFLMLFLPLPLRAQDSETTVPQITVEVPDTPAIVGQPAIVRIKVLVPTFMPQPPEFPSLEQQNLLVRLPERASGPISGTVNGETWSGVQRSYRVYPLTAGPVVFDAQEVGVTYADPRTNDPIQVSVEIPRMQIRAVIPEGAQGLDPLIIAKGFTIEQTIEGSTEMRAGDAITRKLSARIAGTTPLLIPTLTPQIQTPLLRAYPKEPRFSETQDRGVMSGQRAEETVYIAQDGGEMQLPAVSIDWFNLETNQIETVSVPEARLTLAPQKWHPNTDFNIRTVTWAALFSAMLWALTRFLSPRFRNWKEARRNRYLASETYAADALKAALNARDLSAAYDSLDLWKARSGHPARALAVEHCLAQIGAARYAGKRQDNREDWTSAIQSLSTLKNAEHPKHGTLPPLNP